MAMVTPPVCDFDAPAPGFDLLGTDGVRHRLDDIKGPNGTLIAFICNHCPFVLAILDRIVRDGQALQDLGVGVAAICSNDAQAYPADSFENMGALAQRAGFTFAYLHDKDQSVAKAYGAQCTPDFFGYNADLALQYRGRLDASRGQPGPADAPRELFDAMRLVAQTGKGPTHQIPSVGCSIKWRV